MRPCPLCSGVLEEVPITRGDKIIGRNVFCTSRGCPYDNDKLLHKEECNKCGSYIAFYDQQHFESLIRKHLQITHNLFSHHQLNPAYVVE